MRWCEVYRRRLSIVAEYECGNVGPHATHLENRMDWLKLK
jgi:hypothetical protein